MLSDNKETSSSSSLINQHNIKFKKPKDETIESSNLFITNIPHQTIQEYITQHSLESLNKYQLYEHWIQSQLNHLKELEKQLEEITLQYIQIHEQKITKKKNKENKKPSLPPVHIYLAFPTIEQANSFKNYLLKQFPNAFISYADLEDTSNKPLNTTKGWNIEDVQQFKDVHIPGLIIIENFITEEEERELLHFFVEEKASYWKNELKRRIQHFGYQFDYNSRSVIIPNDNKNEEEEKNNEEETSFGKVEPIPEMITNNIVPRIKSNLLERLKEEEEDQKEVITEYLEQINNYYVDQLTVNEYECGQGIRPHVETHKSFGDILCSISLKSASVMSFTKTKDNGDIIIQKKDVDLPRRSLVIMIGECRYLWRHSIPCREFDKVNGKLRKRSNRISLTLRTVRRDKDNNNTISLVCNCKYKEVCDSQQERDSAFNLPYSNTLTETSLEKEYVHKTYDLIAEHWDHTRHSPWPRVGEFIKNLPNGTLIGDIGCGNGKYINLNPNCFYVAMDRSEKLCEICDKKGFDVCFADGLNLPYRSNVFDVTLNIAVLHHISSVARRIRILKELVRVTKPNGKILIYAWSLEQELNSKRKFNSQDVLVPWKLQKKYLNNEEEEEDKEEENKKSDSGSGNENVVNKEEIGEEITFKRYCHVYKQGELDELVTKKVKGVTILESYYDYGNWCLLLQKNEIMNK
ncbi:hypothetical protein ABK040_015893 [Willaertia magna]